MGWTYPDPAPHGVPWHLPDMTGLVVVVHTWFVS